jgi:ABC-type multidrug transport system fused ATPase/permease subunit
MLALTIAALVNLAIPWVVRNEVNRGYSVKLVYILLGLFVIQAVAFYVRSVSFSLVGSRVVSEMREKVFNALLSKPSSFYDSRRHGDLVSRVTSDLQLLQDGVSLRLSVLVRYLVQVIFGSILMFVISPALGAFVLLIIPILVFSSLFLGRRLRGISKLAQEKVGQIGNLVEESLVGNRVISNLKLKEFVLGKFEPVNQEILKIWLDRARISGFFQASISFLMNVSIAALILLGAYKVSSGELAAGDLTAFIMYGVIVAVSFAFLANGYSELIQCVGGTDRVFELIDYSEKIDQPSVSKESAIELRNVSLSYADKPNALKDINLKIPFGMKLGIVGPTGCGKSSLASVIAGFYEPTSGEVLFDGQRARSKVVIVPQEPWIFSGTLRENIEAGESFPNLDELIEKLNLGDLPEEIKPRHLSGGQKQRIGFLRAIVRKPSILVLDEATSAVDAKTEESMFSLLSEHRGTVIIISHRLSSVRNCDKIIVMSDGSIVEEGTHEELLVRGGAYKALVTLQDYSQGLSPGT